MDFSRPPAWTSPAHTPSKPYGEEPPENEMLDTVSEGSDPQKPPSALIKSYRWRPSLWRIRPLLGLLAIAVSITSLLISLAILTTSDGDVVDNWYFQPTVYLAIATAVSNTALQCALCLAAPISWWNKALHGRSIKDLELDWEAGQSFPRAFIKSIKYRRMVSVFSKPY